MQLDNLAKQDQHAISYKLTSLSFIYFQNQPSGASFLVCEQHRRQKTYMLRCTIRNAMPLQFLELEPANPKF